MKMDLRLQAKMTHQLVMTPQLQQAIKLLQLSRQELEKLIEQSVIENPTLDTSATSLDNDNQDSTPKEASDNEDQAEDKYEVSSDAEVSSEEDWNEGSEEPIDNPADNQMEIDDLANNQTEIDSLADNQMETEWQDYAEQGAGIIKEHSMPSDGEGYNPYETLLSEKQSLHTHLMWQIGVNAFSDTEKALAKILVRYLNEDGYLTSSAAEIIAENNEIVALLSELHFSNYDHKSGINSKDPKVLFTKYNSDPVTEPGDFEEDLYLFFKMHNLTLESDFKNIKKSDFKDKTQRQLYKSAKLCILLATFINKLQQLDPPGVFARSLQECLLLQVASEMPKEKLVHDIIAHHFNLLAKQELSKVAKSLKVSLSDVLAAKERICQLEPRPGRKYNSDPVSYIIPDVFVFKRDGRYVVRMNNENFPKLSINPYYKKLSSKMSKSYGKQKNKSDDMNVLTSQYLVEKIRSAEWLIKSIDQRQKTILRVSKSIVKRQQKFFSSGIEALKPMVLKDIADDIDVHESTVSRITANKYMHTPQGIFELKFFFTSGIKQDDGGFISSEKIKDLIQRMIAGEPPNKPLTDSALAIKLEQEMKIKVARRTVAKYREAMRIEPSNRRKQRF